MSPLPKRRRPPAPRRPLVIVEHEPDAQAFDDLVDVLFSVLDPLVHSGQKSRP